MKLALFALVLSTSAWASWLWLWSLAARADNWETRIWFNDWARRGFVNEAWIEGVLFATGMVLNVLAAFRLAAVYRKQRYAKPNDGMRPASASFGARSAHLRGKRGASRKPTSVR